MADGRALSILNPEPRTLPGPGLLHELVAGETGSRPGHAARPGAGAPALDYRAPEGGRRLVLSYGQLHHVAGVLAAEIGRWLRPQPAEAARRRERQRIVPVLLPQAPELYVALLAVLKAGGAFCPIQLDAPPERIRFVLDDVGADVVLTTQALAAQLPPGRHVHVLLVDDMRLLELDGTAAGTAAREPLTSPPPSPEDLAYVMYTSGSTGTPKGVGVSHRAATQSLLAHDRHVPAFARFLQFAAPTFDVSVFEIFFPWFRAATLVSCSRAEMLSDLPAVLRAMDVDACELTPTVAGSLLRSRARVPGLRLLLTIGEMLTEPVVREFGASPGPGRPSVLWAMYGPTEAAIHCTLQPALQGTASVRNIGFPLDTVSAYVLRIPDDGGGDGNGNDAQTSDEPQVVPVGEVGELAVGGPQLACGYINRPEQTAAAFVKTAKYGRLYRTGDKARVTEDGLLECFGRLSGGQVKLRGQRIELGEVEQSVLRADGCVGSVAAVVNGILVAFCDVGTGAGAADGMQDKIWASCRAWLPRFMVPGDMVLVAGFPRLASGKVDRKRLASEYASAATAPRTTDRPAEPYKDDLDRQLHSIARQILGSEVESAAPLAAAGLDSLRAIEFAAAVRATAGLHSISAVDVLESRTLAALHARLQASGTACGSSLPESLGTGHLLDANRVAADARLSPADVESVSECAPVQAAMLAETLSDASAYCNWIELAFAGACSRDDVVSSFLQLIRQTEALRTGFAHYDGRLVQVVWKQPSEGQVRHVDHLTREFQIGTDVALLHPFFVEIGGDAQDGHGVRAVLHIHHAVYDGWSMDLLRRDLGTILRGEPIVSGPPYSSVIQYSRSIPAAQTRTAEQFWAQTLHAFQPSPLPQLNPRRVSPRILTKEAPLLGLTRARVDDVALSFGCSTQSLFQAALAWLWSSLLGSQDVVLGTVTSGRTIPLHGIEAVVGPCLQTVPLRADLSRMQTVRDLISSVHSASRSALPHAFLPLSDIRKIAGLRPGQSLYDVLFVYQESLYSQKRPDDLVYEVAHRDYLETKLLWEVEPDGTEFRVRTTFHVDTFPEAQIACLLDQYAAVVQHIAGHAHQELSSVYSSFLPHLQSSHNTNYKSFDGCPNLAKLVQETARQHPARPAVCFATSLRGDVPACATVTFQELNQLANRIATYLRSSGVVAGDAVTVVMDKSVLLYAGFLGVLKAGCAYLPLLPSTPPARVRFIVEQAGVRHCLTDTAAAKSLVSQLPVECLDLETADLGRFSDLDPADQPADGTDLANIIYTSGSTGVPKGVCVTQLNVCSNLDVLSRIYPIRADGRLLQSCSQAFDVSVFEIFFTWINGMCLCSATNDVLFEDLEHAIRLLRVSHLSMTPTVAALVDPKNVPSVEFLVTAGEPLTENVSRSWVQQLFQGYGPSETTNICTVKKMARGDVIRHLGFGFENTSSIVLRVGGLETVPRGAVGELCFGGDQVVAGYLGLPELTAEKFIHHPSYGRIYRSGDIGRMLPDGSLMITGRMDDQIKLRGQRIELNEINAVLSSSGLLSESLTLLVRHDPSSPEQLASFFVPLDRQGASSSASPCHLMPLDQDNLSSHIRDLFRHLASRLPAYTVPAFLVPISAVPLTPAGKSNKRLMVRLFQGLSKEELSLVSNTGSFDLGETDDGTSQWTDVERKVAGAVAEALAVSVQAVGRWTPLASLGLDSISAIHVSRLISRALGKRLTISDVLQNMSVVQLAQLLKTAQLDKPSCPAYSLDVFSPEWLQERQREFEARGLPFAKALPCMPLQEAMLVSPARGSTASYVNRMLFRLFADVGTAKAAWARMYARHDILRTCFVTTDSAAHPIAQVVLDSCAPSWVEVEDDDGSASIPALVDAHVHQLVHPVDSFQPPVSLGVVRQPDAVFLWFVCHHAIYDGEAMSRLLLEVEQLIAGREPTVLKEPPLPFSAFLELALALPESADVFWQRHLSGYRPTLVPTEKPGGARGSAVRTQALSTPLSAIQSRAHELGVSLLTVCQSSWACVMSTLVSNDDICFGNVYNGRSVALDGVDKLVAPCFNTLPIRANLADLPSNRGLLSYFQTLNPELVRHQFTPLRKIQRQHLGGGVPLFDSLLLLQRPSRALDPTVWTLERDDGEMDLPLVCELVPDQNNDVMELKLHFGRHAFSDEEAAVIFELFDYLARTILQFSASRIPRRDDLPMQLQERLQTLPVIVPEPKRHADLIAETKTVASTEIWSQTETTVRSVLSRLSEVPESSITRDMTIYRLGLDSVRAVQVAAVLRQQGLQLSAVDVMEHPTCEGLARLVSERAAASSSTASDGTTPSSPSIAPSSPPADPFDPADFRQLVQPVLDRRGFFLQSEIEAVLPCTPLQAGLLTEFTQSKGRHYFNFVTFRRRPEQAQLLDGPTWARAWKHAAAVLPMLRTGFVSLDSEESTQAVSPYAMIQIAPESMLENHVQVQLVQGSPASEFSLETWQSEAAAQALSNLQRPPWQVVLVEDGNGPELVCHLAIHHALYDAASLRAVLGEIADFVRDHGPPADAALWARRKPPTDVVVSDILRQVARLTEPASSVAAQWKERASRAVVNPFPTLTPLKVAPSHVQVLSQPSSRPLTHLYEAARATGFTIHAVLQAAWARILSCYVGEASVVFGVVLSGRNTQATEAAVFPCISTLPVVADNRAGNRELVEQLMETNILLHKSQHVPLSQVQQWLGQPPNARLFDTLLVFQSADVGAPDQEAAPWTVADETAAVGYPVSIEAIPRPDGMLHFQITFDSTVLPEEHAALLLGQLDAAVCHLIFHPDGTEDDMVASAPSLYSVLPPRDRELRSDVRLLHQFVEKQAELQPHKSALQFVTAFDSIGRPVQREWTFAELNDRGDKVARIVAQFAQPRSIVAICFDKCPEAFLSMLGILKAGCAFLALDPGAPPSRKAFILQDSGAALLLTDTVRAETCVAEGGLRDAAAPSGVRALGIDEAALSMQEPTEWPDDGAAAAAPQPGDVCYCLYTSGTTGTPKGCAITHENAVQAMLAFQELLRDHHDGDSKWLQFASFHFDVAVLEQYYTWAVGMTLVSAPRDLILEDLAGTIVRLGITHIDLTPSLGRMLDPDDVPSLCRGVFITGGEPLKQEMLDRWGPTGAVHNFYGPTEATIGVTSFPQVPRNGRASNIGRPFPNVGAFVFRPGTQTPVLRGGVGELCVSGKLVGQGYVNRDDLTRERFPTLSTTAGGGGSGERVYRTGDLVRLLHDGCFDFLGRADDQVKLRGQRLEIGEINHAIRLGVGARVGDVATLVVRDEENKKDFLVTFVVAVGEGEGEKAEGKGGDRPEDAAALCRQVQAACRERLPGYMVPSYVVPLPFIPLSPNNKAETKALRQLFHSLTPEERMRAAGAPSHAPSSGSSNAAELLSRDPVGRVVADVLRRLAPVGGDAVAIEPRTSLFELGIDSISVLRLARALKRRGLAAATPSLVLSHPVVGDLVDALSAQASHGASTAPGSLLEACLLVDACQHRNRGHVCDVLGIASEEIEYIAPCSALQQGMVSRSRAGEEAHRDTYFNAFHFTLRSTTSASRLQAAWEEVVRRHAILRTRFVSTADGVVQVAVRPGTVAASLPWVQLVGEEAADEAADEAGMADALDRCRAQWVSANQGDALAIKRPLEVCFLEPSRGSPRVLALHMFHGLYDAVSFDLILGQVAAAYDGGEAAGASGGPTFLEALIDGPLRNHAHSRPFWEAHLQGAPIDRPVPALATKGKSDVAAAAADADDVRARRTIPFSAIERLRVALGVSHAAVVQALWVSVLHKLYAGGVVLGLVLSGRTSDSLDGDIEGVVGPLFNTLPFHAARTPGQTWASLAQACYAYSTATLPFQQVPLRDIQKWCAAGRPLFDVLFSFQFGPDAYASSAAAAGGQALWQTDAEPEARADYPLALEAVLDGGSGHGDGASQPLLHLLLVAKGGVADEAGLAGVLDDLEAALRAFAEDPFSVVFSSDGEQTAQARSSGGGGIPSSASKRAAAARVGEHESSAFAWTDEAAAIRREMAVLAAVPEDAIGASTTLVELGLDSVDTIKLSARLRAAGLRLANSQLVRGQTIAAFVRMLGEAADRRGGEGEADARAAAADGPEAAVAATSAVLRASLKRSGRRLSAVTSILPPTPLQEAMVADMVQSNFAQYFNHDVLELRKDVDEGRLRAAWARVVRDSPILRTVFFYVDSPDVDMTYCQAVVAADEDDVVVGGQTMITEHAVGTKEDLAHIVDEARARAQAGQGASDLFQLAFVHATAEDRRYLVLSMAHALYDGWSLALLHRAVDAAYRGGGGVADSDEGTPPGTESDYVRHISRILPAAAAGPRADSFWSGFLAGAQPTLVRRRDLSDLAHDGVPKTVARSEATSSVSAAALVQFCKRQAVSVQVVGQACWAAVLASMAGSLDLVFGVVLSGRDAEGAEALLFPTMNTVPVRVVLHGTAAELLQYMQANMERIREHQHTPLRRAQQSVAARREAEADSDSGGIFNTLFLVQKRMQDDASAGGEAPLMQSIGGAAEVEYPVCVEMELTGGPGGGGDAIVWRTACDTAYVTAHGAARILHQLDVALRFLLHASSPPSSASPLPASHHVLQFEDDDGGVSVCGLPPFQPTLRPGQRDGRRDSSSSDHDPNEDNSTWSDDEKAIRAVLAAVSRLPEDSIRRTGQTLYHLGLDSISAIKVSSLLRTTRGIALGVRDLLSAPSVQGMASRAAVVAKRATDDGERSGSLGLSRLLASVDAAETAQAAGIRAADVQHILPATATQVHMLSVWQNAGGRIFFPAFPVRLDRGLSPGGRPAIRAAWTQLVAECPMLRTTFVATRSEDAPLVQVVVRAPPPTRAADSCDLDDKGSLWPAIAEPAQSFAFLHVGQAAADGGVSLTLKLHHALYDAVSLRVLLDRLRHLCAVSEPRVPPQQEYAVSDAWIQTLASQASAASKQHARQFWTQYLGRREAQDKPDAQTSPPDRSSAQHSDRVSCFLPGAVPSIAALREKAAKLGVSLQSMVFAVYAKLVSVSSPGTHKDGVVIGIYLANRDGEAAQATGAPQSGRSLVAYPTLCLVPLLVRSPQQRSLAEAAAQVQEDIHAMSSPPSATVAAASATASLWEIRSWTGIQVDSFVNFLLPDDDGTAEAAPPPPPSLADAALEDEPAGTMDTAADPAPGTYPALQGNRVKDAYEDAVDVEVAVRGSRLDIGVFGSASKLGTSGAGDLAARLADALRVEVCG